MSEAAAKPLLLLVDGHSLAFRSFYAFSKGGEGGLATKDGRPTSVTYGFLKSLLDTGKTLNPQGVCIAFDTDQPTFRHETDANYAFLKELLTPPRTTPARGHQWELCDQVEVCLREEDTPGHTCRLQMAQKQGEVAFTVPKSAKTGDKVTVRLGNNRKVWVEVGITGKHTVVV